MVVGFGPFQLDDRRLLRDGEPVSLADRHLQVLRALAAHPGQVLTKDALIAAAWPDVAVSDNSLEQAISALRRVVGGDAIETLARRGYRFTLPVTRVTPRADDAVLEALLGPHRAFVEGRSALETLDTDGIARARQVFEEIVRESPDYAPGHVGLANALVLGFESTRADMHADRGLLTVATAHAREACRLDATYGEAWATLGFVLARAGQGIDALAAARRAVALEPDNWRHHVRLASAAWGEERLRAARRALQLLPGLALAHWLAATVHVARGALDDAERELVAGTAAQDRQQPGARFTAVGLHLLLGLVRRARGDDVAALRELECELESAHESHLYGREARANALCARGAIHQRRGRDSAARDAYAAALTTIHGYPPARAGLAQTPPRTPGAVLAVLQAAAPGPAEWTVPIDPVLDVSADPAAWAAVLDLLRARAA